MSANAIANLGEMKDQPVLMPLNVTENSREVQRMPNLRSPNFSKLMKLPQTATSGHVTQQMHAMRKILKSEPDTVSTADA